MNPRLTWRRLVPNAVRRSMRRSIATTRRVGLDELLDFVRPRHRLILVTLRSDGGAQMSPVTGGVDVSGRIVVSTYPDRAKTRNVARRPTLVLVISDAWNGPWVQVDGSAEVLHMPEAAKDSSTTTGASPASIPTGTSTPRR